ncbi:MAG: antitoxin [Gordonia sp. (in: high G+C Gram-positive bacteria)]|uniref:antitoxin n=1 Tax=Gordonia sp. (in: high G+C Gram-positive bacteria) TaxID=84139 RepID=UPI0039E574E8
MDINDVVNKAKDALKSNSDLVKKAGDAVDKATGGKFHAQVEQAESAVNSAVGGNQQQAPAQPAQPAAPAADQAPAADAAPADDQQQ